jgi:hypothetical protein
MTEKWAGDWSSIGRSAPNRPDDPAEDIGAFGMIVPLPDVGCLDPYLDPYQSSLMRLMRLLDELGVRG